MINVSGSVPPDLIRNSALSHAGVVSPRGEPGAICGGRRGHPGGRFRLAMREARFLTEKLAGGVGRIDPGWNHELWGSYLWDNRIQFVRSHSSSKTRRHSAR